jgi:VWFA-related protein
MMPSRQFWRVLAGGVLVIATGPAKAGHHLPGAAGAAEVGHYVRSAEDQANAGRDAQDQNQPTFRTEANYVRVDVYPTAGGVPVMDLQRDDFEVFEDGAVQRVDAFEHVLIRGYTPQQDRAEPNTVAESRAMAENARSRVFVLFLDLNHVEPEASRNIRGPLVNALNRLIGPDDLVAVMTPEMSAAAITFARRTTTIEGILERYPFWGERNRADPVDPRQKLYQTCYPGFGPTPACPDDDRGVADELIERHRERQTLDALDDLVTFLRGVREERKAVLAISDGWRLFRPNPALTRRLNCAMPQSRVGVDPRTGGLTTAAGRRGEPSSNECEADRMALGQMNSDEHLRRIFDLSNRANAAFYPIDPRGLVVFDTPIAPPRTGLPPPNATSFTPTQLDSQLLQARATSLRDLAFATDGLAIVGTNDLEAGFKRVTDDLSSYYLLGYYSSGKLDGRFHSIRVRVKRPGVQIRARRGYLAPTAAEAARSADRLAAPAPAEAKAAAEARAFDAVLAPLGGYGRDVPLRLSAATGWMPNDSSSIVVVGEVGPGEEWKAGADADVMLTNASGETLMTSRAVVAPGVRGFRVMLASTPPLVAGEYTVRVRARGRAAGAVASNEVLRLELSPRPSSNGAIFIRRGPTTGNRETPAADLRFRRTDTIRVELPISDDRALTARLLDRTGKPIPVPFSVAVRDDPEGSRWSTAQLALSPLAAGDYVIEVTGGGAVETRKLLAFRVVP